MSANTERVTEETPLKFGVLFPTCEIGDDPVAVRDFAQAAEDLGYARIVLFDHVLATPHEDRNPELWGPYTELDPFHEPFVTASFLAALTTSIEFMTAVMVLPQRQTALVAKQAAELGILSNGRFALGVGTGWNFVEYEAMGVDFASRGTRLTEQVEVLRSLWEEPLVDFSGTFHRIDRAGLLPRPHSKIPIWFGGWTPVSLRRAAAIGDGYIVGAPGNACVEQILQFLEEAGRSQDDFEMGRFVNFTVGPAEWTAEIETWEQYGGTELWLGTQAPGRGIRGDDPVAFDTVEGHITAIEDFAKSVGIEPVPRASA